MKINRLDIRNFKKFAEQTFDFHPQFTLLVGENGSGKTSLLDALAVALGVWFVEPPDPNLIVSRRRIWPWELRKMLVQHGDRPLFDNAPGGTAITAHGRIVDGDVTWTREFEDGTGRTNDRGAQQAVSTVQAAVSRIKAGARFLLPILAYYGDGRTWLPHQQRHEPKTEAAGRWDAFYKCLKKRIRFSDLNDWFLGETISAFDRGGYRPGFEVARRAVLQCVPGADRIWYDGSRRQIVLSIDGEAQLFRNLAAGHRMMMAMVADLAIKAVTQNNFLVPPDALTAEDEPLPRVLKETPGVVLIDELDVHLHPRWQRRVAHDLKRTFPQIQFICTSHSPQIIGELNPEEIRLLRGDKAEQPGESFGMDSNWILQVLMGTDEQNHDVKMALARVYDLLAQRQIDQAADALRALLEKPAGRNEAVQRAASRIERMRVLGR